MTEFSRLLRNHYFSGQVLGEADFSAEQDYFRERLRRHNRYLYGWGVVSGLDVSVHDDVILVTPGMAIDCVGNELYQDTRASLAMPKNDGELYLLAEYCEHAARPVPLLPGPDFPSPESVMATRIVEDCRLLVVIDNPIGAHIDCGPGTPGCGQAHPLLLACLRHTRRGWRIKPSGRRGHVRSCVSLSSNGIGAP